jgi:hypothetical protein
MNDQVYWQDMNREFFIFIFYFFVLGWSGFLFIMRLCSIHTHLNTYPWPSFHIVGMFMPNIAATKEYTDKLTVPELRNSSSCHREKNENFHKHDVDVKNVASTIAVKEAC